MRQSPLEVVFRAIDLSLELNKLLFTASGMILSAAIAAGCWYSVTRFGEQRFAYAAAGVALGVLLPWLVLTVFIGALSKISYECVAVGRHLSWRQALLYATRHVVALAVTPLALVCCVGLVVMAEAAVLLLGRVTFVGEILASAFFLPFVIVNMVAIIAGMFGMWLIFPIIVAEDAGVVTALVRLVTMVRRAPAKVAGYITMVWAAGTLATIVILLVAAYALMLTIGMSGLGLGLQKTAEIIQGVPLVAIFPGLLPTEAFLPQGGEPVSLSLMVARYIYSAEFLLLLSAALAFPVTFLFSSNCAVYVVLRQAEVDREESMQTFEAA